MSEVKASIHRERPRRIVPVPVASVVATVLVYVGAVHLYLAPSHLESWWIKGVFFLVVGVAQATLGVLVLRQGTPNPTIAAIVINTLVILVYLTSRTVGIEFGPEGPTGHVSRAGSGVEHIGPLGLSTTALESIVVVLLAVLLPRRLRSLAVNLLLAAGLGLWGLSLTGWFG